MLVYDQLRKNDPQLRLLALILLVAFGVLLIGVWWVQIVSTRHYQASLETQSFRSVRLPALRGKILDRQGRVLAENRPNCSIGLYLEDLRPAFDAAGSAEIGRVRAERAHLMAARETALGRKLTKAERRPYTLTFGERSMLRTNAFYAVASNIVAQIGAGLRQPLALDPESFHRHYRITRFLPFPVATNLTVAQIARFEEQLHGIRGADLEVQSTRIYPHGATGSHVIGYVRRDNDSTEGEQAFFSYRLPDYRGVVGIEGYFDDELRGLAGGKSVLVNNLGYRQSETVWATPQAGRNVVLTLDLEIQRAAERALRDRLGPHVRGAVVILDVHSGDILALVSAPAADPNYVISGFPDEEFARWQDERLGLQRNRATQEIYQPGSIFKPLVGLAALEAGLNPLETYEVEPDPQNPTRGAIFVGAQKIRDTVSPGKYDFRRAIAKSSNSYFITNGLRFGVTTIVELAQRLHLGERFGLPTMQESAGLFPSLRRVSNNWRSGDTANLCIGQGEIAVTPLQMAVMTAAFANGGKVLSPRLVQRIEAYDPTSLSPVQVFPAGQVLNHLGVNPRHLDTLREAMLADTEDPEGTAYTAFRDFRHRLGQTVPMRVCGKTGTAQKKDLNGRLLDYITWFASFAPFEQPRYAVVVMVESGSSGGGTCAPVARDIYAAIQKLEAAAEKVVAKNL